MKAGWIDASALEPEVEDEEVASEGVTVEA